ncbi:MAG: hypothetical protein KKF44_00165 [Nanoarchaeota archaeon]|nr:hypothetical protein [Nanoarchaeota archaeon]
MKKKGFFEPLSDFFLGFIILGITVLVYLALFAGVNANANNKISSKLAEMNNDELFVTFLNTDVNRTLTLSDLIVKSYISRNSYPLRDYLNELFSKIYPQEICWTLLIDDKPFIIDPCNPNQKNSLFKGTATLPARIGETIKLLNIYMEIKHEKIQIE